MVNNINGAAKSKSLVSISQAAIVLGVSIDTVRRWDKAGIISSTRPNGKNRYFSVDELERIKLNKPLTISEAARMLKVSASTLRRLEKKGLISPIRNGHGERRYDRKILEKFLDSEYYLRQKEVEEEVLEPLKPSSEVQIPQVKQPGIGLALSRLVTEHNVYIGKLRKRILISFGTLGIALIPFILFIVYLTGAFLLNPESTARNMNLITHTNPSSSSRTSITPPAPGATVLATNSENSQIPPISWKDHLRPLVNVSLFLVRLINGHKYALATQDIKIADVNTIFTASPEGKVQPIYSLLLDSSKLSIADQGLVFNLNSDLLEGKRPGNNSGDIAILPLSGGPGGAIVDASITTLDIANGAITTDKLAPNLRLGSTVTITTDNGLGLSAINADSISSGTLLDSRLSSNVTLRGNTFNGALQLVQLTDGGILPILSGANLTNLAFSNVAAGTNVGALVIGSGGSLSASGTGTIVATDVNCSSCTTLGGETSGDYVAGLTAGNGLTGNATGAGSTPTLNVVSANGGIVANVNDIALTLQTTTATGASVTTSSGSGLEILAGGLSLLQGCSNGQILKWTDATGLWGCAADNSGSGGTTSFDLITAGTNANALVIGTGGNKVKGSRSAGTRIVSRATP